MIAVEPRAKLERHASPTSTMACSWTCLIACAFVVPVGPIALPRMYSDETSSSRVVGPGRAMRDEVVSRVRSGQVACAVRCTASHHTSRRGCLAAQRMAWHWKPHRSVPLRLGRQSVVDFAATWLGFDSHLLLWVSWVIHFSAGRRLLRLLCSVFDDWSPSSFPFW
ncbi:uncharacterized protein J3D65DRAFT_403743 [Phyllosticta citribraziliensis]|uniref:Secreted protein n=1 Tax=Phyllosticta citribraziliensis TaxID=989973 RepID=A0ABR1LLN4_9PEZI